MRNPKLKNKTHPIVYVWPLANRTNVAAITMDLFCDAIK